MNTDNTINLEVHAHHCEVEPELRGHIEDKISNLERFWPKIDDAHVRLTQEHGRYVAEITLISGGMITRGEEIADNLRLAFDTAVDKLERQLRRYKKKVLARERRQNNRDDEAGTVLNPVIVPGATGGEVTPATAEIAVADTMNTMISGDALAADAEESVPEEQVVRIKRFALKPMSPEEAILQMDLLGHSFFVFRDGESNQVSVVYRRDDGGYGLIEPVAG
jgi:putative sigma-54 modulation protein